MDMATFKGIAYTVATSLRWRVGAISAPGVTPNFWAAELLQGDRRHFLLCSENGNWAVSSNLDSTRPQLPFADCEPLATTLEALYRIRVLSKHELAAPFTARSDFSPSDIAYWKPATLGDALFNWWD